MANPEHLAILKQGVDAWNGWRQETGHRIRPDLSGADLDGAVLVGFNLNSMDLQHANLRSAQLSNSRLMNTDLTGANLTAAWCEDVNFGGANLTNVVLHLARLLDADFYRATLTGSEAWDADLRHANLSAATLERADLCNADLRCCLMVRTNLTHADLTGTRLHGTARDDWIINDIECQYVFWDAEAEIRSPEDRDFGLGEFEQLYRTLPTIEYIFQNGMTPLDPLIMDRVVQAIQRQKPEYDIKIDSISARGLAPSIKFSVQQKQYMEAALMAVKREYEIRLGLLAAERDRYYHLIARAMDAPREAKLTVIESGAIAALDGATINIDQHVEYVTNLRDTVAAQPEASPAFAKVAKKTALDIIGSALKDVAKGQVKEAAKQIYELGEDLGPVIVNTAAYAFFRSMIQGG